MVGEEACMRFGEERRHQPAHLEEGALLYGDGEGQRH